MKAMLSSNERLLAVIPEDHELARKNKIILRDLAECDLVLGDMEQWDNYRNLVDRIFGSRALRPRIAYEASNTMAIMGLVAAGLGVTLYPEGLRRFKPDHVIMREIEDCDVQIETLVAWERNAPPRRVLHFIETCRRSQDKAALSAIG